MYVWKCEDKFVGYICMYIDACMYMCMCIYTYICMSVGISDIFEKFQDELEGYRCLCVHVWIYVCLRRDLDDVLFRHHQKSVGQVRGMYIDTVICVYIYPLYECWWDLDGIFWEYSFDDWYGVASISRLLTITGLFCKRVLWKRWYSAKETYHFKEPTSRSHPIVCLGVWCRTRRSRPSWPLRRRTCSISSRTCSAVFLDAAWQISSVFLDAVIFISRRFHLYF